jgi:hypothetical protein
MTADDRRALQNASAFREFRSVADLPPSVVALVVGPDSGLADPGKHIPIGDFVSEADSKLPSKRLIWAATDGERWVVHYERGTPAPSFHFMVAQIDRHSDHATLIWRGATATAASDFAAFIKAIEANTLDDRQDWYY